MGLDKKKRTRSAKQLKAKSKVKTKSVQTPGGIAAELEALKYSQLKLEDRAAELERRTANLEKLVADLQARVSELAAALGMSTIKTANIMPVSGDEC